MRITFFLLIVCLLGVALPVNRHPLPPHKFVLWDVGQGQWGTWVQGRTCYHFDMGGEKMNWPALKKLCAHKNNQAFFTHADADHINLHFKAKKHLPRLCVQQPPLDKPYKIKLPICVQAWPQKVQAYRPEGQVCRSRRRPSLDFKAAELESAQGPCLKSNALSVVFVVDGQVLVPGDSTKSMEKRWAPRLNLSTVHTLVLGHHGSHSSTGPDLLQALPHLKQAVVSARRQKYGHPHPVVTGRLWQRGVPLLSTHEWGSVWLHVQ